MEEMLSEDDQIDATATFETMKAGAQTTIVDTYVVCTSSAPHSVQFMPPRPRGMPLGVMLITPAVWIEFAT